MQINDILISLALAYIGKTREEVQPLSASFGSDNGCPILMINTWESVEKDRSYKYDVFERIDGMNVITIHIDTFVSGEEDTYEYLYKQGKIK